MVERGRPAARDRSADHVTERDRLESVYRDLLSGPSPERWSESNPGNRAILDERVRWTTTLLSSLPPLGSGALVLDLGSGGNTSLTPELDAAGDDGPGRIAVDLLFDRLRQASPGVARGLVCADGAALPFHDETFDLVALFTVFSSVGGRQICANIASEVTRVLVPGGAVLWYDLRYRNPSSKNLHPMRAKAIEALFPELEPRWRSVTLLPPIARRLGRFTSRLYPALASVPPLRSHLLGTLRKPGAPNRAA